MRVTIALLFLMALAAAIGLLLGLAGALVIGLGVRV